MTARLLDAALMFALSGCAFGGTGADGGGAAEAGAAVRDAGAWGAAALSALWDAADPHARALEFLACWSDA